MSETEQTLLTELLEEHVTSDFSHLEMMHHVYENIYGLKMCQKTGVHKAILTEEQTALL